MNKKQNRIAIDYCIAELNGFLNALERLCGFEYSFGARLVAKKTDLLADLTKHLQPIESIQLISYRDVEALLDQYIYKNLNAKTQYVREVNWHLIEYYGLAYTAANSHDKACLNSLVSNGAQLIQRAKKGNQVENFCFAVDINSFYILTCILVYQKPT